MKVEPTPPMFVGLGDKVKVEPPPPITAGKAGILLPALHKVEPPPPAPNGILFPVFIGR